MKITKENYMAKVEEIGSDNLPALLKDSHQVIMDKTENGTNWDKPAADPEFTKMSEIAFEKLGEFIDSTAVDQTVAALNDAKDNKKTPYAEIAIEISFIRRFLEFDDKILYKKTFEIFIDDLQKAILEKKITRRSPVAKEIQYMQEATIAAFNRMRNAKHFQIKPETVERFKGIIEKYENAYEDMDDKSVNEKKKSLPLEGLNNTSDSVMCSTEFTALKFDTIGFKDKWLDFIGDPAPGFTAMVYGRPKMGKSYLCVDFAGYLARNHGKVLYVAKEEKLDKTLQDKLKNKDVAHVNLFVADSLPADLTNYDFIFLDSVNKLGLNAKDLEILKESNKRKSFVYVFQVTKNGKFRGNNEFQHNVDVVIEIPEQGKAVQYGRFSQGSETLIF